VSTRSPQDPASEHEANSLLPNFWLSEPRPLPARLPRPCSSGLPPSLRSSPSPTKPLRRPPVLRRTRQPPRRDKRGLARLRDTRPYAPTRALAPASARPLRFPGPAVPWTGALRRSISFSRLGLRRVRGFSKYANRRGAKRDRSPRRPLLAPPHIRNSEDRTPM
jgi:hypothetical protein